MQSHSWRPVGFHLPVASAEPQNEAQHPTTKGTNIPGRPVRVWRAVSGLGPHPSPGGLSFKPGEGQGAGRRAGERHIAPGKKLELGLAWLIP